MTQNPHISARLLRRLIYRFQNIRGIPRLAYLSRYFFFGMSKKQLVDTPEGIPITINIDDIGQLMHFYFPYCSELRTLLYDLLLPGDFCIDLGANSGIFSSLMAECVSKNGIVIAVDPNPGNISQIQNTIKYCDLKIIPLQAAVAGKDSIATFILPENGRSESGEIFLDREDGLSVRTMTIQTILNETMVTRIPDFIKYDIEGAESELLESLNAIHSQGQHPILLVEFHPNKINERKGDHEYIRKRLRAMGYEERHVTKCGSRYMLLHNEMPLQTNANILYLNPKHRSKRDRIQSEWS